MQQRRRRRSRAYIVLAIAGIAWLTYGGWTISRGIDGSHKIVLSRFGTPDAMEHNALYSHDVAHETNTSLIALGAGSVTIGLGIEAVVMVPRRRYQPQH